MSITSYVAAQWVLFSLLLFRALIFMFLASIGLDRRRRFISAGFTIAAIFLAYWAGAFSSIFYQL